MSSRPGADVRDAREKRKPEREDCLYFWRTSMARHRTSLLALIAVVFSSCQTWAGEAAPPEEKKPPPSAEFPAPRIEVAGEVAESVTIDLSRLPLRSVVVREAAIEKGVPSFVGAYRYDGYALADILEAVKVKKRNAAEFPPPVDLLIRVENAAGDFVALSWGEVMYAARPCRILVAVKAADIPPAKTGKRWPLPGEARLVCADDRFNARSLPSPNRVMVFSCPQTYAVDRAVKAHPTVTLKAGAVGVGVVCELPAGAGRRKYDVTYYGHGMGFRGFHTFEGAPAHAAIGALAPDEKAMKRGYLVVVGADGYRAVFSCAEIFARADCDDPLLVDRGKEEGGRFNLYAAADFYADRSVKCVREIARFTLE